MQTTTTQQQFRELSAQAKRFALKYGQIGIFDADDIAQSAMLRLLNRTSLPPATLGWLYKTVRSVAFDAGRRKKVEANYFATPYSEIAGIICERADNNRYVAMHTTYVAERDDREPDLMPRLKDALSQLPPQLRQVLVLYAHGYKYEEIAALTKVNVGTVRSRMHHARRQAQNLLSDV